MLEGILLTGIHVNSTQTRCTRCSYVDPREDGGVDDISGGSQPTMWSANCGASFGHELMFSMTLEKAKNGVGRNFETVKIAHGGSRMFEDWYPNMDVIGMLLTALYGNAQEQGIAGADFFGIKESRVSKS